MYFVDPCFIDIDSNIHYKATMFRPTHFRYLSILALSLLLSLPGLTLASHLHVSTPDEVSCEICGNMVPVVALTSTHLIAVTRDALAVDQLPAIDLPQSFLIHRYQRGPPLQS